CLFYMFWKIKKMLVSSTNIKKYRALFYYSRLNISLCISFCIKIFVVVFNGYYATRRDFFS
ncbi:hypothetical protein FIU60_13010, partial [Enterococcus faecium]